MAKTGLGKGLDLLIPKTTTVAAEPDEKKPENTVTLKLTEIEPNRDQPRKAFDDEALDELARSIKQYGVIQPVIVCKKEDYYEIIAGERRWRAARKAGLSEIPVVIRDYGERERAEISLIENIQRENLNPIEEALAYKQLIDEYSLTQETLAERVAKSRFAITNTMRLLKLNEKVQKIVAEGKLSGGHARALLAIEDESLQYETALKIINENMSVRQVEDYVKSLNNPVKKKTKTAEIKNIFYEDVEKQMTEALGTKVKVSSKNGKKGKIEINYYSPDELDRLLIMFNGLSGN